MGAYVARRIDWAKSFGPTSIVDPSNKLRGHTKAHWVTHRLMELSPYIGKNSISFLPCGLMLFLMYDGGVAARDALDQSLRKSARRSHGLWSI